jgi:hypothetical protein
MSGADLGRSEIAEGTDEIERVHPYGMGIDPPTFRGDYTVWSIATQRTDTGEYLEAFVSKSAERSTPYKIFDPLLQQLLVAAFQADREHGMVRVSVQFASATKDIVAVTLGERECSLDRC